MNSDGSKEHRILKGLGEVLLFRKTIPVADVLAAMERRIPMPAA